MLLAARATSGNHGSGIYHNKSLFLGIFKKCPFGFLLSKVSKWYMDTFILYTKVRGFLFNVPSITWLMF